MLTFRDLAAGLLLSLALVVPQELPQGLTLKTGEQRFCRGTLTDLKGVDFPGVVRASAEDDVTSFEVYLEHPTYKAKTDEEAFKYGAKRRANITVTGRTIDDGDIIVFDGTVFIVSVEKPAPAEALKAVNGIFNCIAGKKS